MSLLQIDRERCHRDGICADVCPVDIPVGTVFRAVGEKAQAIFDYHPGRSLDEAAPVQDARQVGQGLDVVDDGGLAEEPAALVAVVGARLWVRGGSRMVSVGTGRALVLRRASSRPERGAFTALAQRAASGARRPRAAPPRPTAAARDR